MDACEGSLKRRAREFVEDSYPQRSLAEDEQETSIDSGKRLSSEFMLPLKEKVDKAKLVAVDALDGEPKRFSGAAAAAAETATDEIQTEKMDKTVVAVLDGEKNRLSTITGTAPALDSMQTEKMDKCAESDPPAGVNGRHRLPDDYVSLILGLPTETPIYTEDLSSITDLAKLLNCSEDWIEEQKQAYLERAALSKRMRERFVQFQDSVREDWFTKGYVEMDDDFDIDAREAMIQEINNELWEQHNDFSCITDLYDPDLPVSEVNCTEEGIIMVPA